MFNKICKKKNVLSCEKVLFLSFTNKFWVNLFNLKSELKEVAARIPVQQISDHLKKKKKSKVTQPQRMFRK